MTPLRNQWTNVIIADGSGTPLGPIMNLKDRNGIYGLRRPISWGFTMDTNQKMADYMYDPTVLLKIYEEDPAFIPAFGVDAILRFVGPVLSADETEEGTRGRLAVTAADPSAELAQRRIGRSNAGVTYAAGTQKGAVVTDIINTLNAQANTRLRMGNVGVTPVIPTGGVGPWYWKGALEAINEIAQTFDGFDWEVRPVEPYTDGQGLVCGLIDIWAAKGSDLSSSVFWEKGWGRHNVKTQRRPVTRVGMANVVSALPPGFPETIAVGDSVQTSSDADSIAKYGWQEDVVTADIASKDVRKQLIDQHVAVRRVPRQQITFDPMPFGFRHPETGTRMRVPRFKVDWDTGDVVTYRAVRNGYVRVNASLRTYSAQVALSENGLATVSPTLTPDYT